MRFSAGGLETYFWGVAVSALFDLFLSLGGKSQLLSSIGEGGGVAIKKNDPNLLGPLAKRLNHVKAKQAISPGEGKGVVYF